MTNTIEMKTNEKLYDVYISYSHKDSDFTEKLVKDLKRSGIRVFIDYEQFSPGQVVVNEIERGILNSQCMIIILSPDYLQSKWTEFEKTAFQSIDPASSHGRIIPVLCSQTELPPQIGRLHHIDFINNYESGLNKLLNTLPTSSSEEKTNAKDVLISDLTSTKHQILKIFLCHFVGDRDAVRAAYTRLIREGFEVWFDEDKLMPGHDWDKVIVDAIRGSDIVLIFLSNKAINTLGYFQKEIRHVLSIYEERAISEKIFFIPVRLEECVVPKALSNVHYTDLFDERDWTKLIYSLRHRETEVQNGIGVRPETIRNLEDQTDTRNPNDSTRTEEKQRNSAMKKDLSFWEKITISFGAGKQISDFSIKVTEILNNLLRPGANDVEKVAATQIQLLTSYYSLVLSQAQRSFNWALIWATIGVLGFIMAGIFLFINQISDIALIGTIGSALIEVISGINFYLYNKASAQLAEFHTRLDATQKLLLSNAIAEKIDGELKQITRSHIALKFAGIDVKPEVIEESLDLTPKVHITHIELNPSGSDVAKEYISIENSGKVVADMTNWSLSDLAGHTFKFPMFFLKPGSSVNIWTRNGKNIPTDLYWKMKRAIWNNNEDIAYLKDSNGSLIDSYSYSANKKSSKIITK